MEQHVVKSDTDFSGSNRTTAAEERVRKILNDPKLQRALRTARAMGWIGPKGEWLGPTKEELRDEQRVLLRSLATLLQTRLMRGSRRD